MTAIERRLEDLERRYGEGTGPLLVFLKAEPATAARQVEFHRAAQAGKPIVYLSALDLEL